MSEGLALPSGWRTRTVGEATVLESKRVGSKVDPLVFSSTKHYGLVPSDEYFKGRKIYSENLAQYRVVEPGWFAYATNHLAEGSIGLNQGLGEGCVSPMYTVFSASDGIDPRYLLRVLKSPEALAAYAVLEQASVDRRGSIRYRQFAEITFRAPPVEEQRRIAEVLDTIDEIITVAERVLAKRQKLKIGVEHDLLHPLTTIPRLRLGDVAAIVVGIVIRPTQYYRKEGIPVLRSSNVTETGLRLDDLVFMSRADHMRLTKSAVAVGDVLTVRTGYPGTTAVVGAELEAANCVDIIITRVGPTLDPHFLATWVNSEFGKGQVLRAQGGLAQQHFNVGEMKNLLIPDIPVSEQRHLVNRIQAVTEAQAADSKYLDGLIAIRRGLIGDLLSGRVRTAGS